MSSGNHYKIVLSKQAEKDAKLIYAVGLADKVSKLLEDLAIDPYNPNNHYEELKHDLSRLHSKRVNIKHRLVYEIDGKNKIIIIHRMWSHYDKIK